MSDPERNPLFISNMDSSNHTLTSKSHNLSNELGETNNPPPVETAIQSSTSTNLTTSSGQVSSTDSQEKNSSSSNPNLPTIAQSQSYPISSSSQDESILKKISTSNSVSNQPSFSKSNSRSTGNSQVRKNSFANQPVNVDTGNFPNFKMSIIPGNRTSTFSDYSGIVQHVDIDTIKYVGNKESLQLSYMERSLSSAENILNMNSKESSRKNSIGSIPSVDAPKPTLHKVPSLDNHSMAKVIKLQTENSPNKARASSSPPKSPLPQLKEAAAPPISTSPLKKKFSRTSSRSSSISSHLHGKLDNIMKEVEDLKLEIDDDNIKKSNIYQNRVAKRSLSSTNNSVYTGTNSFHTANSEKQYSPKQTDFENFDSEDEQPTENLHIVNTDTQKVRLDPLINHGESPILLQGSSKDPNDYKSIGKNENVKMHRKSSSSHSTHGHHGKNLSSHKSKRKSMNSKNKLKPFSYETLAKLLNATDGIIIGQEFATLNIPSEEKFLIERIVDSISRLTANMILNPARYDQSCARLERVLNVLEGFE
jgi:hypothetical protein